MKKDDLQKILSLGDSTVVSIDPNIKSEISRRQIEGVSDASEIREVDTDDLMDSLPVQIQSVSLQLHLVLIDQPIDDGSPVLDADIETDRSAP